MTKSLSSIDFGEADLNNLRFAVRSSALGEDSEELSAAGQNSTFLGTKAGYYSVRILRSFAIDFLTSERSEEVPFFPGSTLSRMTFHHCNVEKINVRGSSRRS